MSTASEKQRHGDEDTMQIHISGHLVRLSFAKEPDTSAVQRVRPSPGRREEQVCITKGYCVAESLLTSGKQGFSP